MEITHDFHSCADSDSSGSRLGQLEMQVALCQQALGHDLPNQMVSLQGLARVLEMELEPYATPETREVARRIANLARSADERMRHFAALGRLLRREEQPQLLDFRELAREASTAVKLLLKGHGPQFRFREGIPLVMGCRDAVYQILCQLLRNSLQAAVADRALSVEADATLCPSSSGFEMTVTDNGRGMTEVQLEQVKAVLAGNLAGTGGLGFVLVRQLVAGWQGAVSVRSEQGQGTTVTVLVRTPESKG